MTDVKFKKRLPITWYVTFAKLDGELIYSTFESIDIEGVTRAAEKACSQGAIVHEITTTPPRLKDKKKPPELH